MIQVTGLVKRFNATEALRNVSFLANDGVITGLLGANGAGKSTTLRIIAGLMRPDQGFVQIDQDGPHPRGAQPATLGALLDHAGLYQRLTALENLAYFGKLHGLSASRAKQRAIEVLNLLGMHSEARRVARFSLGQRAKIALGRAIMHAPRNLLLDEPTNGLDVPTIRALRVLLRNMRDAGCCIVFSSHVLDEVEQLCDQVVIMAEGTVAGCGSPSEIRRSMHAGSLEDAFVQLTETSSAHYA
jgi:sodium transport system ATP-binding protein